MLSHGAQAAHFIYWYCVDFMVNLARLTGSSYLEANTWVLLIFIPVVLISLLGVRVAQRRQLRRLEQVVKSLR